MKNKYLYQISAFLIATIMMSGCIEWEEFKALDLDTAPTVTVAVASVSDSVIVVDVTSSADGYVAAILLEGTGNAIPSDSAALLKGNVSYLDYSYGEAVANGAVRFTFASDVQQDADYEVMAVSANTDGVVSSVVVLEVGTTDTYAPRFVAAYPDFTYSAIINRGDTLVLEFDEPVSKGSGKFSFETFFSGQIVDVPTANVIASGYYVYIILPTDFAYREYIWLHWEEGAVVDASGNEVEALTTFFDGDAGAFVGAYWRMVAFTYSVTGAAPAVADAQTAGFDIVLTYGGNVGGLANVKDGTIKLSYDNGAGIVTTVGVPAADVSTAGTNVTILQTVFTPVAGTVKVDVPAGIFTVGIGNPTAAYSATWNLE